MVGQDDLLASRRECEEVPGDGKPWYNGRMKLWYEDEAAREGLAEMGLAEVEKGYWANDRRHVQDFDGGITLLSQTIIGDPRFDVQTTTLGEVRDFPFFIKALKEHVAEITRRTELLREQGLEALLKLLPAQG
jgi:hypothetical protein